MSLWKSVFGESQEDVWRRVADVLPGRFEAGGLVESPKVHAELAGFNVVLDIYTVNSNNGSFQYTRLRAPFINAGRLRFGIGKPVGPNAKERVVGHVLGDFAAEERTTLPDVITRACDICEGWNREGLQKAMNRFNGK